MRCSDHTTPAAPARLEVDNISAGYNHVAALRDVSMQVPHGARVAVVGPNGSGKSTLFKALAGLLPLTTGYIHIHGEPLGAHRDCVAYVPQREEVDWRFPVTSLDVVLMGRYGQRGWIRRLRKEDREIARRCLGRMGMSEFADRAIADLSGGQQQRVFLARALAQEPHILLMDEPFNGVDVGTRETILNLLDELTRQRVTALVSTHDLNMAATRFDLVALLNVRLIAFGPPKEVFTPQHVANAFGGQALFVEGGVVVDQCCPGDTLCNLPGWGDSGHHHGHPPEDISSAEPASSQDPGRGPR